VPARAGGSGNTQRRAGPAPFTPPDPAGQSAGVWTPVFWDEFDSGVVADPAVWADHLIVGDHWRCNDNPDEVQWYTHDKRGQSVANSLLTLTARRESPYTADPDCPNPMQSGRAGLYTSSMISSHPGFQSSYPLFVEVKFRHPTAATGQWPAIWTLCSDGSWPPEDDLADMFSGTTVSYNAWPDTGAQYQDSHGVAWGSGFHTIGEKWLSTGKTWYLDGTQVSTTTTNSTQSMHVIVNFAVQFTASGGPWSFDVDYVRAWKLTSGLLAKPVISSVTPSTGVPTGGSLQVAFAAVPGASSYRVTACAVDAHADGVELGSNNHQVATGASSPITISGLTNGARYTTSVAALSGSTYSVESALVPALS
jgi:Glycosyl hydrolases family 16